MQHGRGKGRAANYFVDKVYIKVWYLLIKKAPKLNIWLDIELNYFDSLYKMYVDADLGIIGI